ncbi:hypothetical protein Poly30_25690 [Planctomycetes bacterium Poly30]|uniref:Peptidase C39-like domain-containing protein n=1 Tax=Saltatorellus ferox TaxID=2528018 RepID=A0A518ESH9_9BACT|nr:hypothetical protein Poly30_25690 [Planctomycetes bacterium Poly30]
MTDPSDPAPTPALTRRPFTRFGAAWLLTGVLVSACASSHEGADAIDLSSAPARVAWTLPDVAMDPLHRCLEVTLNATPDGTLVSESIGDGAAFTEALPSWNVPSGTPFTVEIRALAAATDGAWSPWLRIGEWAAPPRGEDTPTRFDFGKVAVDVLQLQKPHRAVELRFRGTETPLDPADVAASVVLSDMGQLNIQLAATGQEPWRETARVEVEPRSQRTVGDDIGGRICSPTSVSMVSAYQGADVPTRTMAETLFDADHDIYGNWNRAVQGPATLGIPGRLVRVSSWDAVADYLDRGLPVVASIRAKEGQLRGAPYNKTAGHLLVVTGLGPKGKVHVNDPAARLPLDVPRVYRREDMEQVWFANGGVGYVFGPRIATAGGPIPHAGPIPTAATTQP